MKITCLDHGYVEFIEAWGTGKAGYGDERTPLFLEQPDYEMGIVEAARQSTQGSFRDWEQDAKLLKFLYKNNHATPFEFAGLVMEIQAPIFVFREWQRHRTQSHNEMSARYAPLPDLYYVPDRDNLLQRAMTPTANKQAGGTAPATEQYCDWWLTVLEEEYKDAESRYKDALANGIPKELARVTMPVGHYSRMRASANLRNWLAFLTLRQAPNAQWEIRQYANAVGDVVAKTFPRTWELYCA